MQLFSICDLKTPNNKDLTQMNALSLEQNATTAVWPFDESLFRAAIESVKDGILIMDNTGKFLYWNHAFMDMWDILPNTINTHNDDALLRCLASKLKDPDAFVSKTMQLFHSPEKDFNTIVLNDDKVLEHYSAPLLYARSVQGRVWSFKDITDKKHLESQLVQAQKMEAIGTLAAGVAHDFNNILMVIQGSASLLLMDDESSPQCRMRLKEIQSHIATAAELIQQLLGFAGESLCSVQPVDVEQLIRKTIQLFFCEQKGIVIDQMHDGNLWKIQADQMLVEQVILNLLVNACHAMPNGGRITVQTHNVKFDEQSGQSLGLSPGSYVKTTISDTGMGMDQITRKRIFEPFFSSHEMGRGAGLGLASAYGIVKKHGGMITVSSQPGKGTTFIFYLPVEEIENSVATENKTPILAGSETILLVDDEEMVLDVGSAMLMKMGYEVLTTATGKDAVATYAGARDKIDLVILDMVMPEMSGKEIFSRLKQINPDVRVVLSSGYSINEQASEIMDSGCSDFIQKPFNMAQLSRQIRDALA